MSDSESSSSAGAWLWPVVGAAVCLGLGAASGLSTVQGGGAWYEALSKPPGTPPSSVFGPVWSILYVLMGISAGRLVSGKDWGAVTWFIIQLLLNLAWTPVFFGAHRVGWALVVIISLWTALTATVARARRNDELAAWLLIPYLFWVMYASYLNAGIFWLNR